ncbi:MAG: extracellular solute-binding protein [Oscillospiraceae bacterium]|nr:extracellular solute-binding protein [Oscillospiraceae bacterium]
MKKIIALLLAVVMVLGLAACGQAPAPAETKAPEAAAPAETKAPEAPAAPEAITLKVWGPNEDQATEESFLQVACAKFAEAHPEYDITFVFEVCAEGDAGGMVTKDPSAAADVYMYANDQLGALLQANAIARLGGDVEAQVKADNSETMVASVSKDGALYGVPFTGNTWFMYYDKSVYTEEDIKSLDAMMAKKPIGFEVTNTWYLPAFYFAAGGSMFGPEGTDGAAGVQFGGEAGAAATMYVANALAEGKMIEAGGGVGLDKMRNGEIGAMFSGTWDAGNYADALGENYAAAQLPCITINGEECQLRSFAGSKAFGVNPNSANVKAASQLAAWLGSAEMQDLHFELRNGEVIPCSVALIESGKYDTNPAAVAQNDTIANTSFLQPTIPEMNTYWGNANSMGQALVNGEINADNAAAKTDEWNAGLNNSGL